MFLRYRFVTCAALAFVASAGCGSSAGKVGDGGADDDDTLDATTDGALDGTVEAKTFYAIDTLNVLISFSPSSPGTIHSTEITGLEGNEVIVAMDFRPSNGLLYALGSTARLYILNPDTGATTMVGPQLPVTLAGAYHGMDFNPMADRLRLLNPARQNIRIDPNSGMVIATDTTLSFAAGDVAAGLIPYFTDCAFTHSYVGATVSDLYAIDTSLDVLVRAVSPNGGTYATVGELGFDAVGEAGFDIVRTNGEDTAYVTLQPGWEPSSSLYTIDLATGHPTLVAAIAGEPVHALTYRE